MLCGQEAWKRDCRPRKSEDRRGKGRGTGKKEREEAIEDGQKRNKNMVRGTGGLENRD